MKIYHLGVMVDWEYDEDFVRLIEEKARASGLETLVVWPAWVEELSQELIEGRLNFKFIVDRASLSSPEFIKLILLAQEQGTTIFDPPDKVLRSADKATMHLEFISQGILTPYTIILPPFEQAPSLDSFEIDLSPVGQPFVIKPANMSGGGLGVNKDGFTLEDIQRTRQEFPQDKYLIQERIEPKIINGQRFWFRIFYSWGLIQACWWNDETHVYKELIEQEITDYCLEDLFEIIKKIQEICGLNFFSSEIVMDSQGHFVVVDYVNEICDMRLQSRHYDGVPDQIAEKIAKNLIDFISQEFSI